jgi:YtkA-like
MIIPVPGFSVSCDGICLPHHSASCLQIVISIKSNTSTCATLVYEDGEGTLKEVRVNLSAAHPQTGRRGASTATMDRWFSAIIVGSGVFCFVLLAWVHLGLGALLMPPAATTQQQVTIAGPNRITLVADSGQLTAHGPNTLSFELRDRSGKPVSDAVIQVQPVMTTMAMESPTMVVKATDGGRYVAQPQFLMAGDWRLDLTITQPGALAQHAAFTVSVRWS